LSSYWSYVESLSRHELVLLQERRLKSLLDYLDKSSFFYRNKLKECGCSPKDFTGLDNIRKLSFTTKEDLIKDVNKESTIFYKNFFVDQPDNILRWHKTSGTTGMPVRIADTFWDWNAYSELTAEALYGMGISHHDIVVVPFGYGPFIAFWIYIAALEKIGAAFIPSGGLDSKRRIALIKEFRATVLISTPSYAVHLGEVAHQMGIKNSEIRLVITTGEPKSRDTKRLIKEIWGADQRDRLGCAETGGIAFECPFCSGIYHIQEGFLIPEVVNSQTGDPVEPGEEGELIVTPLYRRGMPLLRFKTGNIVKLSKEIHYRCKRNFLSLEETENGAVVRRSDMLTKVRGVLIDPVMIENIIREFRQFSENFQILLEKVRGLDEVTVKVELRNYKDPKSSEDLIKQLKEALREQLMIRVNAEVLPLGSLQIDGNKVRKVIDLRKGTSYGDASKTSG
jgi:phenylacetate-CoA ligase